MFDIRVKVLSNKANKLFEKTPLKYQSGRSSGIDLVCCGFETQMLMQETYVLYDIDDADRIKYDNVDEFSFKMFELPGRQSGKVAVEVINGLCKLAPGAVIQVKTGIALEVPNLYRNATTGDLLYSYCEESVEPEGYKLFEVNEIQIRSRSGLASKKQLVVINQPGTIDNDYRGELIVTLKNLSNKTILLAEGDRIAQAVICPIKQGKIVITDILSDTERGEGGFGSTGN